jgi:biotin carboxylase
VPHSIKLESLRDLTEEKAAAVGFPLLVKPLNGESGHGIRRFDDYSALRRYLTTPGPYRALPLKLQRFIVGPTIGLSMLAHHGEIVCHDVQRHAEDGSRVFESNPAVLEIGRRIVAHFGYGGPGHIDFVQESETGRLYALEFNCRYWYSLPVSLWRGGNFPALAVDLVQGRPLSFSPTRPGAYFQPGAVVALAKRPWRLARLDSANWRGFCQAITDPFPHLLSHMRH